MKKQNVYFVPFSESGLENKLFTPFSNTKANVPPFDHLKTYLHNHDIEARTIDFWDEKKQDANDVVIVCDHPPVGLYTFLYRARDILRGKDTFPLRNRRLPGVLRQFKKRVLMQWESPVNNPWVYKNIQGIAAYYNECYFIPRVNGFPYFYYPQNFDRPNDEHFNRPSRKFMVMMNRNTTAKGFWGIELYGERERALKFFSAYGEVELYGPGWDADREPFIKKIRLGFADDKPRTMSEYTFALCFENAVWPGYVTEKIFDCLLVGTIPVYWGAPDIEAYVPADCFIDMRKFKTYGELRTFLRALTVSEIGAYRKAIQAYFESARFKQFTPGYFFETVLKIIRG